MSVLKGYIKAYDIISVVERGIIIKAFYLAQKELGGRFRKLELDTVMTDKDVDEFFFIKDTSGKLQSKDVPTLLKHMGYWLSGKLVGRGDISGWHDLYVLLYVNWIIDGEGCVIIGITKNAFPKYIPLVNI